ncbi:MAG: LuxR C-terminal-related transcriptional regulator [Kineosporiaceae bacterium]
MTGSGSPVRVVVGVDGSGRTHALGQVARPAGDRVLWVHGRRPSGHAAEIIAELAAVDSSSLVVLDDAHTCPATVLDAVADAGWRGVDLALSRPPGVPDARVAAVEELALRRGRVVTLTGLDPTAARQLAARHGRALDGLDAVLAEAGGAAWIVAELAVGGSDPRALLPSVERRLSRLDPQCAHAARLWAVAEEVGVPPAHAVAAAVGDGRVVRVLWLAGLLDPRARVDGRDALVPAVAAALRVAMADDERTRHHVELLAAVAATGTPGAVPSAAVARALTGAPSDPADLAVPAVAAHRAGLDGRPARVVEHLLRTDDRDHRLLAVPALVATGRAQDARDLVAAAGESGAAPAVSLLAQATVALLDRPPQDAAPHLVEACEAAADRGASGILWPHSPAAVAAPVLVAAADARGAQRVLAAAVDARVAGSPGVARHRLLAEWVRLRAYGLGRSAVDPSAVTVSGHRDRSLATALRVGLARRRGDVVTVRDCGDEVDAALARHTVDLFDIEVVEELLVAAAWLGELRRVRAVLSDLEDAATAAPAMTGVGLAWIRLQVAIVGDDAAAAAAAATEVARAARSGTAGERQRAQAVAAEAWARALSGDVADEAVLDAVDRLAAVELPWEAGRLAGQAAVRVADPPTARRLLERARDLSDRPGPGAAAESAAGAGLSDREVAVARLVVAGSTHREIGAQLYISPKTVEHHVARIRVKVGARTRAEFLAALRTTLALDP